MKFVDCRQIVCEFVYIVVVELSAAHISGATNMPGGEFKNL